MMGGGRWIPVEVVPDVLVSPGFSSFLVMRTCNVFTCKVILPITVSCDVDGISVRTVLSLVSFTLENIGGFTSILSVTVEDVMPASGCRSMFLLLS